MGNLPGYSLECLYSLSSKEDCMYESRLTEQQLMEHLLVTLRSLPNVEATLRGLEVRAANDKYHDAEIDLKVADRTFRLLIEAKKNVYPRDVRQIIWQIHHHDSRLRASLEGDEAVSMLVAESISPGAKDLLKAQQVGYYDSGGSLFLPAHGTYLYIEKPPPRAQSKFLRSLFSGRRAQVLLALLVRPKEWFGVTHLAERALVSPATASQVISELERLEWLDSRGQGPGKERVLKEPAALLDAWVRNDSSLKPLSLRRYFMPEVKATSLLDHIGRVFGFHKVEYAVSFEAAAQAYAPLLTHISQVRCRLLPGTEAQAALSDIKARVVTEGSNLAIIEAKSPGELLFRENIGGHWLASPIQVYLDLLRGEGRAKEMAEHLRKEKIGF